MLESSFLPSYSQNNISANFTPALSETNNNIADQAHLKMQALQQAAPSVQPLVRPQNNAPAQNYHLSSSVPENKRRLLPFASPNTQKSTSRALESTTELLQQSQQQFEIVFMKSEQKLDSAKIQNPGTSSESTLVKAPMTSLQAVPEDDFHVTVTINSPESPANTEISQQSTKSQTRTPIKSPKFTTQILTAIGRSPNFTFTTPPHLNIGISNVSSSSQESDNAISLIAPSPTIPNENSQKSDESSLNTQQSPQNHQSQPNPPVHTLQPPLLPEIQNPGCVTHPPSRHRQSHEDRRQQPVQPRHRRIKSNVTNTIKTKPPTIKDSSIHTSHPQSDHPYYRNTTVIIGGFKDMDSSVITTSSLKEKSIDSITPDNSSPSSPTTSIGNLETSEMLSKLGIKVFPKPPITSLLSMTSKGFTTSATERTVESNNETFDSTTREEMTPIDNEEEELIEVVEEVPAPEEIDTRVSKNNTGSLWSYFFGVGGWAWKVFVWWKDTCITVENKSLLDESGVEYGTYEREQRRRPWWKTLLRCIGL